MHFWLAAEPSELALGVVAMALLRGFDCGLQAQRSCMHSQRLTVSQGVESFHGAVAIEQPACLLYETGGEHGSCPLVKPLIQLLAGRVEANAQKAEAGERVARHDFRKRLARNNADLDGANQLGRVVGVDARRRGRVQPREEPV